MPNDNGSVGRFLKHSYIYAIGNIINRIGAFLLLPIYTNYLTVGEYGALELFYGVSAVVFGVLSIGLAHATLRFYFEYDDQVDRHSVVSTNFIASFLISIVGVLIISLWSGELSKLIFDSDDYKLGIYIILGTLVFELSSQICLAYVRAIERSLFFVYIAIVKLIIQVTLNSYLVIVEEAGVVGILFGNFVAVCIGWIILGYFTMSRCKFRFELSKLIPVLTYSFPFLLSTLTGLVSGNFDKFTLNHMESLGVVGIYALAIKFSMLIEQLVGEPFSRSYGSFRFSIMKQDDAPIIQANVVRYLFISTVSIALGMSVLMKDILMITSDDTFVVAADFVPLVLLASLAKIMSYPFQTGILIAKKTKFMFYISAITALVSVVANLLLIPKFGLLGACFALIMTHTVAMIATHYVSQKYFKCHYETWKFLMVLALACAFYYVSRFIPTDSLVSSIPIKLTLISIFIFVVYKLPVLTDKERIKITQFLQEKLLKRTAS